MRERLKQSMKAVLAILAGVLLATGGLSWVEADQKNGWHHCHTVYAFTSSEANGKCSSACASSGHSAYRVDLVDPGTWECECKS